MRNYHDDNIENGILLYSGTKATIHTTIILLMKRIGVGKKNKRRGEKAND